MDHLEPQTLQGLCAFCGKGFATVKLLNRHMRRVHNTTTIISSSVENSHIICSLCNQRISFRTYEELGNHLKENHNVSIEVSNLIFSSKPEFEKWKDLEEVETTYALERTRQRKEYKEICYICNRSDNRAYTSNYNKRTEKSGGTIKIEGVCPSRLVCKFYNDGKVCVVFWRTHVGHNINELRSKHLSNSEKNVVIEKLHSGVTTNRILEDARKLNTPTLQRINLLNRDDLTYLSRKHNITNKRDQNEMVAAALKVQEWNAKGKNFAFFFKQEGETHNVLKKEDFAIGFMNSTMENKLKQFSNIICMDGTHGTNRKGMDLTVMLIKDDKNAGFPVAFFLTNRLDQQVQEVFLDALKDKIKEEIKPEYFMSDDDPKYFNAWVKIMENKPKRLLCTWHVVKNWNIQGKKKIKDAVLKNNMKTEMKKILNETDEDKFLSLTNAYLLKLQEANETDFVMYLLNYYFQNEERINMWAHCYRKNAGINTNMAIETLNNKLKTNQLKRNARVTIEKLLDAIEDLVDIKMWKRILDIERPNANNYQDRIIIKAHKRAEIMKRDVEVVKSLGVLGKFQVKSTRDKKVYNIRFNKVCESECRTLYCRVCKICIHLYICDCPEYTVRNTLCKHVHLVRMYEERMGTNSVLDETMKNLEENSLTHHRHDIEIKKFLEEKTEDVEQVQDEDKLLIQKTNFCNWINTLDGGAFNFFLKNVQGIMKKTDDLTKIETTKRKMEKQDYFPSSKHQKKRSDGPISTKQYMPL